MPNWWKHIITGKDNTTVDIGRVSWLMFSVSLILGAGYELYHSSPVSLREFAEAAGIITGAHGAAIMMKKETEPNDVPPAN